MWLGCLLCRTRSPCAATNAKHPVNCCLDTKKLGRFDKPGHRVTGDRTQNTRRAGWQALHVANDDHSRAGFSQMLADERAMSACAFLLAELRYYKGLRGLDPRISFTRLGPAAMPADNIARDESIISAIGTG